MTQPERSVLIERPIEDASSFISDYQGRTCGTYQGTLSIND
jgi:hypothetical protein